MTAPLYPNVRSTAVASRWPWFGISLCAHLLAIGVLTSADLTSGALPQTRYKLTMLPKPNPGDKVIWYETPHPVPEVAPARNFGPAKVPQGRKDRQRRTLIAQSPHPRSSTQFILESEHPAPLPTAVRAPNLVIMQAPSPPKPQPKAFIPPPMPKPKAAGPASSADAPSLAEAPKVRVDDELITREVLSNAHPKLPVRQFVPPPQTTSRGGRGGGGDAHALPEAPAPSAGGNNGAGAQTVILGLNPAPGPIPEGSLPAGFAVAPVQGPASSGSDHRTGAAVVPGLAARGIPGSSPDAAPAPPEASSAPKRYLLKEFVAPSVNRTLSAPLRPGSRIIPAAVESRFANRNVYTLVIPGPDLPEYNGDWVLWFSERKTAEGAGERVSSPVPARKYSVSGVAPSPDSAGAGTVQLSAVLDRDGRVSAARVIRAGATTEAFRARAIQELQTWEFQPAQRNGEPIEVDIVVEIGFQFVATH